MKKVLFASSECVPFIKTGGLADVVGSLPKCFDKRYYDVRVILPDVSGSLRLLHWLHLEELSSLLSPCFTVPVSAVHIGFG